MTEAILSSLIAGITAILGSIITNNRTKALICYRLDMLEKKQDVHNSLIERTYKLEEKYAVLDNKEKVSEHRIDDLERRQEICVNQ